jgi:hypothetical protein
MRGVGYARFIEVKKRGNEDNVGEGRQVWGVVRRKATARKRALVT